MMTRQQRAARKAWKTRREWSRAGARPYIRRAAAVAAFLRANDHVTQPWGGEHSRSTGGEFDAVNERYERRGKRRATTIAQAVAVALGPGPHFWLHEIDLDTLNETAPATDARGCRFRLPNNVEDWLAEQRYRSELEDRR